MQTEHNVLCNIALRSRARSFAGQTFHNLLDVILSESIHLTTGDVMK